MASKRKSAAKRSCNRGNKKGSVVVKSHKSKGKSISCHRRRKPVRK